MVATELGEELEVQQTVEQTWWDTALMNSGFNVEIPELRPQEVTIAAPSDWQRATVVITSLCVCHFHSLF